MKYQLTQTDTNTLNEFVERSTRDHLSYGRTYDKIAEDIRVGKAGEIAYKHLFGSDISEIDWTGRVQADGIDFTHRDGRGIQVKTLREDSKWCSFSDWKWDVIVAMRQIGTEIHLIGEFDRSYIETVARPSNWKGWFFDPTNC